MKYLKSQIQEISSYKCLCWYGCFLSLTHVVTFFFFHNNGTVYNFLTKNANTLCWPQLPFCEYLRFLSPIGVQVLLYVYLCMALFAVFLFLYSACLKSSLVTSASGSALNNGEHISSLSPLSKINLHKKLVLYAYCLLLIINIVKGYVFFMDYRFMGNYHYMPFLVSFVYLFIRQKLFFIPLLIVCFYFFAGLLKISNFDWLTGLAFLENLKFPLFFNESITMILCFYVVCLEIIGVWSLVFIQTNFKVGELFKNFVFFKWKTVAENLKHIDIKTIWKIIIYFQLILFHILSYFIVGYFYPLIMFCLLSLFFFMFIWNEQSEILSSFDGKLHNLKSNGLRQNFLKVKSLGGRTGKMFPGIIFMCLVVLGNLLSVFIPGVSGLTGEGRWYGLNMYDAHTQCDSQIFLKFKNKIVQESFSGYREYALRIRCDPYIDFNTVKKICAFYKNDPEFMDLDWSFYSKLRSDLSYKRLVNEKNVCGKNLKYFSWRKNQWIAY